jgi:TonB-dependent receptor
MFNKIIMYAAISMLVAPMGAFAQTASSADQASLEEVVVTGVRHSEQQSVELKRDAASIQDSIAAEDFGKLPDTTIADSLQRITGVQIDREGGEGTTINIRGLPQVATLLNGEAFITAGSIVAAQPNFEDIPSQLFAGADVIKSPTANLLDAGITGTVNLRTWRPFDLRPDWTFAASAAGVHGPDSDKYQPMYDGLVGFHGEHWGFLVTGSYSDVTLENSTDGADQYTGQLVSESSDSATEDWGFLNAYLGAPLPSGMKLLYPSQCTNSGGYYSAVPNSAHGCAVDVNGDGQANAAFYFTPDFSALDRQIERKRTGFNASLQADLSHGFNLTSDFFYTDQHRYDRTIGYQLNTATWNGATFLPITARNTGVPVYNDYNDPNTPTSLNYFYTTQRYEFYMGDIETYSEDLVTDATSRNFNLQLAYNQGGNFTGELRGIYANAAELFMASYLQYANSNGELWPNEPVDAAPPGSIVVPGGSRVFNPYGMPANVIPATVDMTGNHLGITVPSSLASTLQNPAAWVLKTVTSENDHDRNSTMNLVRADGHYKFSDHEVTLDFGARFSQNSAENTNFSLIAPVWGGAGAYNNPVDPLTGMELSTKIPNSTGCYVHYKAADVLLDGEGIPGACKAGDPLTGFYRANPYAGLNPSQLPAIVAQNTKLYNHLANVEGVGIWTLDPKIMDDVLAFQNALYPGEIRDVDPGGTWRVDVHQTTGYVQGNFKGTAIFPFTANVGLKLIKTDLNIDQHKVGGTGPYYVNPEDLGVTETRRNLTDTLPVINIAFDLRSNLRLRLAYSKNMQLLNLDQWGGGLTLDYAIVAGTSPPIAAVRGGTQNGNPDLDPWRSTNYDMSLEYYISHASMVSLAAFYVYVDSFIAAGAVVRCDLPDQDGVVRNRCVAISGPVQGAGKSLQGLELGWKQAFDFLPGRFSNLGIDANYTYSPSDTGRDVAGHTIPFQDNSVHQANLILWYQEGPFQARVAGNYRSKRAVAENYGGITGFEEYQDSTFYLDASTSFDFAKHWTVFAEGSNLTRESEHYYLVWPDQKLDTTTFEPRYTLGVRAKF